MSSEKPKLLVTGFGPFGSHEVNASWESVKQIPSIWTNEKVDLVVKEVPVSYDFVQSPEGLSSKVPQNVCAVIHVGVSSCANKLTLECLGHNSGYDRPDIHNQCPPGTVCVPDSSNAELKTSFDVTKLVELVNSSGHMTSNVEACDSCDAGRYLCDFIYYRSLHHHNGKALFIHVPPLGKPYTAEQMGKAIKIVLEGVLLQLP